MLQSRQYPASFCCKVLYSDILFHFGILQTKEVMSSSDQEVKC